MNHLELLLYGMIHQMLCKIFFSFFSFFFSSFNIIIEFIYSWAAKNLLNDIDLMVISPSGKIYYGNNRQGDEFNPLERVVINHPEKGEYKVHVTTKQLSYGTEQLYSIVITSVGYVEEGKTITQPITFNDLNLDDATRQCQATASDAHLLRFQLEDWKAGLSWSNIYFTITELNEKTHDEGKTVYIKTFLSNHDRRDAVTNRIEQFSVCLQSSKFYQTKLEYLYDGDMKVDVTQSNMKYIRVSSPQCNIQLSYYWQKNTLKVLPDGTCNPCNKNTDKKMELIMLANVTDDDFIDYSWYFIIFYFTQLLLKLKLIIIIGMVLHIMNYILKVQVNLQLLEHLLLVMNQLIGNYIITLLYYFFLLLLLFVILYFFIFYFKFFIYNSWCIAQGSYELKLFDSELFELRQKHAAIRVSNTLQDLDEDSPSPYLYGTGSLIFTHGDGSLSETISSYTGIVAILLGLIIGFIIYFFCYNKSQDDSHQSSNHSNEKSPLLPSSGVGSNRGVGASVELSKA